jgi:hypothetical protein
METHAWIGGIDLEVESRGLNRFLLVTGKTGEAVSESVGDSMNNQFCFICQITIFFEYRLRIDSIWAV